jgi:Mlc titration factor MtfA (ptsG expression regulator)
MFFKNLQHMQYQRIYEFLSKYLPSFSDYTTGERRKAAATMEDLLARLLIQTRQNASYQDEDLLYLCLPFVQMTHFIEGTNLHKFRRIIFYPAAFESAHSDKQVEIEAHDAGLLVVSMKWLQDIYKENDLSRLYEIWAHILFEESYTDFAFENIIGLPI